MPDVNLLRDTKQPEVPKKPEDLKPSFDVTDPAADAKPGIGGFFRSLLKRKSPSSSPEIGVASRPMGSVGSMSLGRPGASERILSETKKVSRPAVIPLPDDEGGYNVNLLTEDLVSTFDPKRKLIQLGLVAVAAIAVVTIAYFGLKVYGHSVTKQVTTSKQELAAVETQIGALNTDQASVVDTTKKLSAIKALIDQHIRWTRFFAKLEHYTLPTVTYGTSFAGDISGSMTLSATTTSFDDVAKQYLVFQQAITNNDFISTFTINGAAASKTNAGERVSFTVSFTILPELLQNPPETTSPSSTTQSSADKAAQDNADPAKLSQTASDVVASICDLYDHPTDISFFPLFAQADAQSAVTSGTKASNGCTSISAANMTHGVQQLKIDQDKDGLNAIYEVIYGSKDTSVDSNGNGVSDYQEASTSFTNDKSRANTNSSTTITNVTP